MNNMNLYGNGYPTNYWYSGEGDIRNIKGTCEKYMNFYVIGQLVDGSQIEGIIEDMDDDNVTMLVPEMVEEEEVNGDRQFGGYGGYGYDGFGGYGGYRRRYRRFRRRRFPFRTFAFPFFFPFPFYY